MFLQMETSFLAEVKQEILGTCFTKTNKTNEILKFYVQGEALRHLRHSFASFFSNESCSLFNDHSGDSSSPLEEKSPSVRKTAR